MPAIWVVFGNVALSDLFSPLHPAFSDANTWQITCDEESLATLIAETERES